MVFLLEAAALTVLATAVIMLAIALTRGIFSSAAASVFYPEQTRRKMARNDRFALAGIWIGAITLIGLILTLIGYLGR